MRLSEILEVSDILDLSGILDMSEISDILEVLVLVGVVTSQDFVLRFWKISGIPESCEVVIFVINMFGHL